MIRLLLLIVSFLYSTATHPNWSSTAAKDLKQPVNFSGKITTHQDQEFIVDNISVYGKYEKVPVIDKPGTYAEPAMNTETKQLEIKLQVNPNTEFTKTYLDLNEIKEMSVPSPDTIWVYQKKERSPRVEFIELDVITKSGTKSSYLLEAKTPIYCDAIDPAGPQEKTVPLSAVKTLTIEGYTYRDTSKDKNKKCDASGCPPCEQKQQ